MKVSESQKPRKCLVLDHRHLEPVKMSISDKPAKQTKRFPLTQSYPE